jgi:hypothetical protein
VKNNPHFKKDLLNSSRGPNKGVGRLALILEKWVLCCLSLLILSYHSFANGWQECFIKLPHTCQAGCMVHKLSGMENMGLFTYGLSCVSNMTVAHYKYFLIPKSGNCVYNPLALLLFFLLAINNQVSVYW